MPGRRLRALAAAAASIVVLAGCAGDDPSGGGQRVGPAPSTTAAATAAGDLLSFTAPAIGGGEVDVASFSGRPTLLWFWAPW